MRSGASNFPIFQCIVLAMLSRLAGVRRSANGKNPWSGVSALDSDI
jgi:hypothetical protein